MLQHNWQRSNRNECEQIMKAYKCKDGSQDYPISLMRDNDREHLINYLIHHQSSNAKELPLETLDYLEEYETESYKLIVLPKKIAQWLNPSITIKSDCIVVKGFKDDQGRFKVNVDDQGGEVFFN